jgi:hypothetical protein
MFCRSSHALFFFASIDPRTERQKVPKRTSAIGFITRLSVCSPIRYLLRVGVLFPCTCYITFLFVLGTDAAPQVYVSPLTPCVHSKALELALPILVRSTNRIGLEWCSGLGNSLADVQDTGHAFHPAHLLPRLGAVYYRERKVRNAHSLGCLTSMLKQRPPTFRTSGSL